MSLLDVEFSKDFSHSFVFRETTFKTIFNKVSFRVVKLKFSLFNLQTVTTFS